MIVLYIIYIVIMYFNPRLAEYFISRYNAWRNKSGNKEKGNHCIANDEESDPLLKSQEKSGSFSKSASFTHSSHRYGSVKDEKTGKLQLFMSF